MGQEIKVTGLVLNAGNIGEFDKRVTILTKERGRITAFARGAKKATSPYAAACQPFTFGEFSLYEGRSSFNLMWADVGHYFEGVKDDLLLISYGSYFCEFVSYLTRENNDEMDILKLLYQSLRALEKKTIEPGLIRRVFEIKIMALYGQGMEAFCCTQCGSTEELSYFDSSAGGVLCSNCGKAGGRTVHISGSAIYTIQYILSSPLQKLYTFKVSEDVMKELDRISESFLKQYVSHHFKSLDFLELL
ncbi:DNA repair protein RecO [Anaerostipes sp.]|uniref:DNA repair protein RecO n=1 Tax=Anaerostipes sp. TaxID=1872530 RepID=UPI0025BD3C53|nr:DNA repair protein RecO [Anaerostipes sp.]MBS7007897.1 DNA repair protein RecO [Anaerostipes sp.]